MQEQRSNAEATPYPHDVMRSLQSLHIVVGDPYSFCQSLFLALDQPFAESVVCPGVDYRKARPVYLIQIHTLLI